MRQGSDGSQEHVFSSGDFRLSTSSHQGDRVLMAVRKTSGDHQEIAGSGAVYGPLQSSHQGDSVLIDQ